VNTHHVHFREPVRRNVDREPAETIVDGVELKDNECGENGHGENHQIILATEELENPYSHVESQSDGDPCQTEGTHGDTSDLCTAPDHGDELRDSTLGKLRIREGSSFPVV
jgi:hypothetical protein